MILHYTFNGEKFEYEIVDEEILNAINDIFLKGSKEHQDIIYRRNFEDYEDVLKDYYESDAKQLYKEYKKTMKKLWRTK